MLKEGFIYDYATKKMVDYRKPEEKVRQEYEKSLIDDYYYEYSQIDIEVPISIGSSTKRADIVIYKKDSTTRNQYQDIIGIVETKSKARKDGIEQLTSYMQSTSCLFGVWTNGNEILYLYKFPNGEVKQDYLFNIPQNGEEIDKIGQVKKSLLKPVRNLKPIFRRMLNTLYSNTNISRREKLGSEMIKILFCKIIDEKYDVESLPEFRLTREEREKGEFDKLKKRIQVLFKKVKDDLDGDDVFASNEEITLDQKSIAYVVGELESISLLKTSKDVVGEAFETFAESKLVGEKGEFFTPREVVKLAIQLVDPEPAKTIVDPACGSGGFLIYALEHIWNKMDNDRQYKKSPDLKMLKKNIAEKCFYGIDKENDLVKICKAYMTIIGDGKSKIAQENSLHMPEEFNLKAKELFTEEIDGKIRLKQFDYVITNPPFGSKIKVLKSDAKNFKLGHKWKYNKAQDKYIMTQESQDTPPQELFIERCLDLLKDGGKLAIVLPDTYLHAPTKKHVLQFLQENNNLLAVVDLPHNTFRPYCNAKTCLIVLQKGVKQSEKILMAVAEQMGHDHKGDIIFRYDTKQETFTDIIWDDTRMILEELSSSESKKGKYTFQISIKEIKNNLLVPKYYWNPINPTNSDSVHYVSIQTLIDEGVIRVFKGHGSPPSGFKGKGEVPYVRVDDVMNWEIYKNPTSSIPRSLYDSLMKKKEKLLQGDIVFVKEGSYRIGSVAMLSPFDTEIYLNHHSLVFRIVNHKNRYHIDEYYLLYLLSSEDVQSQLINKIMVDTTLPNIGDRWKELKLPILLSETEVLSLRDSLKKTMNIKWQYKKDLLDFAAKYGKITT